MRLNIRKMTLLSLFTVGLLLFQAGVLLLHHHYSDSYHDDHDGFHTLNTDSVCPASNTHSNPHADTSFLIPPSQTLPTSHITCNNLDEPFIKHMLSTSPHSGTRSRASPV